MLQVVLVDPADQVWHYDVPAFDANGNVAGLVNILNGAVTAEYDYDAFGRTILTRDYGTTAAANNPFRFSTKYIDDETAMYYYGYRFYAPEIGRWPSRDPIGEKGGVNLHGFLENRPVILWDILGMRWVLSPSGDRMWVEDRPMKPSLPNPPQMGPPTEDKPCRFCMMVRLPSFEPIDQGHAWVTLEDSDGNSASWGFAPAPIFFEGDPDTEDDNVMGWPSSACLLFSADHVKGALAERVAGRTDTPLAAPADKEYCIPITQEKYDQLVKYMHNYGSSSPTYALCNNCTDFTTMVAAQVGILTGDLTEVPPDASACCRASNFKRSFGYSSPVLLGKWIDRHANAEIE